MTGDKQIFWLAGWSGDSNGGFFCRNDMKEFFERCEKQGMKIVGIVYDGSYDLEFIIEKV